MKMSLKIRCAAQLIAEADTGFPERGGGAWVVAGMDISCLDIL